MVCLFLLHADISYQAKSNFSHTIWCIYLAYFTSYSYLLALDFSYCILPLPIFTNCFKIFVIEQEVEELYTYKESRTERIIYLTLIKVNHAIYTEKTANCSSTILVDNIDGFLLLISV